MPSPAPVPHKILDFFLFPSPSPTYSIHSFPGELIWIPRRLHDGDATDKPEPRAQMVPCLFKMFESSHFLIIYFHSNAEDLGVCRWFADFLHEQFQVHVLAVEYPGYGVCPGKTTPEGVIANAHAALQLATKTLNISLDRILVFGRSLGTGPAIDLAARHRVAGLVLITPFTSVKEVFRSRVGNLADVLPNDWFQNLEAIKLVRSPTLVVHGKAIYKECIARKGLVCPPQMSHNSNITADLSIFVMPMLQFFPIPDCCFDEVKVPMWIYDKSWSPDFKKDEEDAGETCEPMALLGQMQDDNLPTPRSKVIEADVDQPAPEIPYAAKHPRVRHSFIASREYDFEGVGHLPSFVNQHSTVKTEPVLVDRSNSFQSTGGSTEAVSTV